MAIFKHEFTVNPAVTMTNVLDVIWFLLSFGPRQEVGFVPNYSYYLVLDWLFISLKHGGGCHTVSEQSFCHTHNSPPPPIFFSLSQSNLEKMKAVIQFLVQVER